MEIWQAVMRMVYGTNTRCTLDPEREAGERMVADAEAKVRRLHMALDERPAENLDEAIRQFSGER